MDVLHILNTMINHDIRKMDMNEDGLIGYIGIKNIL